MTQLWAWEYEGKTEVGIKSIVDKQELFAVLDWSSLVQGVRRTTYQVTNLRKVKVVDEDAVQERTSADLLWVHDGKEWRTRYAMWRGKPLKTKEDWDNYYLAINPPVTEPKNFGAIVEASHKGTLSLGRIKWVRLRVEGYRDEWWSDKNMGSACWSDLNNPTIISEGVEGWIVMTQ